MSNAYYSHRICPSRVTTVCLCCRENCKKSWSLKSTCRYLRLVDSLQSSVTLTRPQMNHCDLLLFQIPSGMEKNNGYSHSGDSAPSMSDASTFFVVYLFILSIVAKLLNGVSPTNHQVGFFLAPSCIGLSLQAVTLISYI